jgi:hypothetical protein
VKFHDPLTVFRLEPVLLLSVPVFLDNAQACAILEHIPDLQSEDFPESQTTGGKHREHHPVLTRSTFDNLADLLASEAWSVLLPHCWNVEVLVVPWNGKQPSAGFRVFGITDHGFEDLHIVADRLGCFSFIVLLGDELHDWRLIFHQRCERQIAKRLVYETDDSIPRYERGWLHGLALSVAHVVEPHSALLSESHPRLRKNNLLKVLRRVCTARLHDFLCPPFSGTFTERSRPLHGAYSFPLVSPFVLPRHILPEPHYIPPS